MPTISAFWGLRSILILLSSGISRRQGAHQVAQKFTIRGRPPKLESLVGLPSRSARVMSGRVSGTFFLAGVASGVVAGAAAGLTSVNPLTFFIVIGSLKPR